ncbi:MAG: substrate-binding domain-containing protein [Lachnospiraceae bacterium]|jgi:D-xylose transport system substrate-binding protein|nr:substrate-binding domain-containing protein [Lachnospiraceae bacterium]
MRKVKVILSLLLVSIMITLLCSCGSKDNGKKPVETTKKDDGIKIGMTFDTFVLERWQYDRDEFVNKAKSLGASVNVQNANGDAKKQEKQIREFVAEGVDAIVIVAVDCYHTLDSAIEEAKDHGIKIISYDRLYQTEKSDLFITVDSKQVGEIMASEMIKSLNSSGIKSGTFAMIEGPKFDTNSSEVNSGFENTLSRNPSFKIVWQDSVKGWIPELGGSFTEEILKKYPNINGIMCANDGLAVNSVKVLSEHKLAGKVRVVGQDADVEACQKIVQGTMTATVYKPIKELANRAAEYTVDLVKGKTLDVKNTMTNEVGAIPFVGITPQAVTKKTMQKTIFDSGFHMKEEVYLK